MRRIVVLFLVALAMSCVSCSMFETACAKTAPARGAATLLVADAQTALSQAEVVVTRIANPDLRDKAIIALGAAQAALRAAQSALHGVETACTTPDINAVFGDFVSAWKALAPFLALLGGPSAGTQVQAPLVVGMVH